MLYKWKNILTYLNCTLSVAILGLAAPIDAPLNRCSALTQTANRSAQAPPDQKTGVRTTEDKSARTTGAVDTRSSNDQGIANSNEWPPTSPGEKRRQALSLLDSVIVMSDRITPVEYCLLVQVEAATLVWTFDRERSTAMLTKSFRAMRELLEHEPKAKTTLNAPDTRAQRVWFSMIRKVAALSPDLLPDVLLVAAPAGRRKINAEWTAEARAVMGVASDQIQMNPAKASLLAEQSLSLGFVDWTGFLEALDKRNSTLAEKLGLTLLDQLGDSSVGTLVIKNLGRYYLGTGRSPSLRDYFLQCLATRLRRDIRPDTPIRDLEDDLSVARGMSQSPAVTSSEWQQEFAAIIAAAEASFAQRSIPVPGPRRVIMVDASVLQPAAAGDTQEVSDSLARVAAINDPQTRDKEYRKLALVAALKADILLAEDTLSKIKDEAYRQVTTVIVYGPFVRKAIGESDWAGAQKFALKIQEPLGRTLVLDRVAREMSRAGEKRASVLECLALAQSQLERNAPGETVAVALLILARSLQSIDAEHSLDAIRSSTWVLNRLVDRGEPLGESTTSQEVATWVTRPNYSTHADEALDLPDLIGAAFKEVERREPNEALPIALGLYDRGMRSFAELAISRELLEQANAATTGPRTERK